VSDEVGAGTLKCVSASSSTRPLRDVIERALLANAPATNVRHLFGDVFLVHTEADTAAVRDALAATLADGESAFVAEFERWSGWGDAVDTRWLLRRGH
jgi:hypothetical protein